MRKDSVRTLPEMFLKYHFAETKTLCTSFAALVSTPHHAARSQED